MSASNSVGRAQVEKLVEALTLEQRQEMAEFMGRAQKKILLKAYEAGYTNAEEHHRVGAFAQESK